MELVLSCVLRCVSDVLRRAGDIDLDTSEEEDEEERPGPSHHTRYSRDLL